MPPKKVELESNPMQLRNLEQFVLDVFHIKKLSDLVPEFIKNGHKRIYKSFILPETKPKTSFEIKNVVIQIQNPENSTYQIKVSRNTSFGLVDFIYDVEKDNNVYVINSRNKTKRIKLSTVDIQILGDELIEFYKSSPQEVDYRISKELFYEKLNKFVSRDKFCQIDASTVINFLRAINDDIIIQ